MPAGYTPGPPRFDVERVRATYAALCAASDAGVDQVCQQVQVDQLYGYETVLRVPTRLDRDSDLALAKAICAQIAKHHQDAGSGGDLGYITIEVVDASDLDLANCHID